MSQWIQHVKAYQRQNPHLSYKEAMSEARSSYQPMTGGKFNVKKALRKTKNTVKRVGHEMDKNQHLIDMIDTNGYSSQVRQGLNTADNVLGGKFKLKRALRKAKNTVNTVSKIATPMVGMVAPELLPAMSTVTMATGGKVAATTNNNKYIRHIQGGSFKTHGGSFVTHGGGGYPLNSSGVIMHPSFYAKPPKTYSKIMKTN